MVEKKKNVSRPIITIGTKKVIIIDNDILQNLKSQDPNQALFFNEELTEEGSILLTPVRNWEDATE